jgi:hypothetical protein
MPSKGLLGKGQADRNPNWDNAFISAMAEGRKVQGLKCREVPYRGRSSDWKCPNLTADRDSVVLRFGSRSVDIEPSERSLTPIIP